jgi:hypothetical protein
MFSLGTPDEPLKPVDEAEGSSAEDTSNLHSESETNENTDNEKESVPKTPVGEDQSKSESAENATAQNDVNAKDKANATASGAKKPKVVLVKEPLGMTTHVLDIQSLEGGKFKESADK